MKNIIVSVILFAAIFIISLVSVNYLNKTCASMLLVNTQIENSIKSKSWEDAEKHFNTFSKQWEEHSNLTSVFIHHMEIDDISMELEKLSQSIKYKDAKDAMESTHSLRFLLEHIMDLEKINVQNVF
ncbi:DUF4363 family protein [Clostridium hydrogenum]|uniref:DUF4363 family protein n=1 Tax=Clostridium hydrogenum TaxID=2855764 RepID=UPI001F313D52|nr:DUF4363 family protein [Clostridium hydrogenum]